MIKKEIFSTANTMYAFYICAVMVAVMLVLASCTSTRIAPTAELQAAESAIKYADQARAADYASVELNDARTKLDAARTAVRENEMELAQRLAEESRAAAELATSRADVGKEQLVNNEMQKSIDTLKQEMLRNSGETR